MDNQNTSVEDPSDMNISSHEDGFEQRNEENVELEKGEGESQAEVCLQNPEMGMTFDSEQEVREYYQEYAKSKGFGITRRSSRVDDNGELKYLTLCCSRYGKTQSNSKFLLKPVRMQS